MLKSSLLHLSKTIFLTFVGYLALLVVLALALPKAVHAERIKDIAMVEGARTNQLIGFGLVVGLDGTGDQVTQTPFTIQAARSMLQQFGVNLPPGVNPQTKNMASVIVTAELPAFTKPGQKMDITVSSIGNAKSLRGGELLLTQLKGGNGEVYAVAQGGVVQAHVRDVFTNWRVSFHGSRHTAEESELRRAI